MPAEKSPRELIIAGRLEDAAEMLLQTIDTEPELRAHPDWEQLHDRAVHGLSRLNELRQEEGLGVGDDRDRNRLRLALIDLDRDVEAARRGERITSGGASGQDNTGDGGSKKLPPWVFAGLGAVALGLLVVFLLREPASNRQVDGGDGPDTTASPNTYNGGVINLPNGDDDPALSGRIMDIMLYPEGRGIGTATAVTGSLVSNGDRPGNPPRFGDTRENREVRAFLSFSLSRLPANAKIVSADFFLNKGGGDYREMRRVLIHEVDIEDALDQTDFNASGQPVAVLRSDSLEARPEIRLDVREVLELAMLTNRSHLTLRLEPDEVIRNRKADQYQIRHGQNRTRLEVKLQIPE